MKTEQRRGPIGIVTRVIKKVRVHQFVPFICSTCHEERFFDIDKVGHRLHGNVKKTMPCACGSVMKRSRFRVNR